MKQIIVDGQCVISKTSFLKHFLWSLVLARC